MQIICCALEQLSPKWITLLGKYGGHCHTSNTGFHVYGYEDCALNNFKTCAFLKSILLDGYIRIYLNKFSATLLRYEYCVLSVTIFYSPFFYYIIQNAKENLSQSVRNSLNERMVKSNTGKCKRRSRSFLYKKKIINKK